MNLSKLKVKCEAKGLDSTVDDFLLKPEGSQKKDWSARHNYKSSSLILEEEFGLSNSMSCFSWDMA